MKRDFIVFIFAFIVATCLCSTSCAQLPPSNQPSAQQLWVDSVFNSLTMRERIAQLFMVAAYSNKGSQHVAEIEEFITKEKIGGLIFFQGGPLRQAALCNHYQSLSRVPLLVAMDAEWGLGMRLDSTFSYPRPMMMGALADTALVYSIAADIGRQLKRLGVHVNFAPVVDVNSNPKNPVIHNRAFGDDVANVTQMGVAYMRGIQDNGLIAVAKHFPGHGDTHVDSHVGLPRVDHDTTRLHDVELKPFTGLVRSGVRGVMVSHLCVPALETDSTLPATLSEQIVNQLLMQDIGFNGLVFSDAMNMKALTKHFSNVEANIRALLAGNDVLEFALDVKRSIDKIERLVKHGRLDKEMINAKCRKVLNAKYLVGLNNYQPVELQGLHADLNRRQSEVLRRRLIAQSLTLLGNARGAVPIKGLDTLNIAYVEIGKGYGSTFYKQMSLYAPVTRFCIDGDADNSLYDKMLNQLEPYNLVIVGCHRLKNSAARHYGVSQQLANFVFDLSSRKSLILNLFGSPYALLHFYNLQSLSGIVVAYDNSADVQDLTAQLLFGGIGASGRLPVSVGAAVGQGSGWTTQPMRLAYALPEEIGIDSRRLLPVDSIAQAVLDSCMSPGLQVLAAKDGVVFFNRCYGRPTYQSAVEVDPLMLYDVASITKVAATLPLLMRLYDQGRVTLESTLGRYTNLTLFPDKASISIRDLLLHRAGLKPAIPFYINTLATIAPRTPLYNSTQTPDYPFKISPRRYLNKFVAPDFKYYRSTKTLDFPVPVAQNMFVVDGIVDTMFARINGSPLENKGKYRYSDLCFMYLQRVVENVEREGLHYLADSLIYRPLGMNHTCFNPLQRFARSRIVPTEYDLIYRKQLLQGYVHDPAAAMLGGVAGHAGLFSNANDLAKLMQMYLWRGWYGGKQLIQSQTVDLFSTQPADSGNSRRALGFDRRSTQPTNTPCGTLASSQSYGHLGFTGSIVWADPRNGLVYVLLANRIYPDANNRLLMKHDIRTKIHDVFYRALQPI